MKTKLFIIGLILLLPFVLIAQDDATATPDADEMMENPLAEGLVLHLPFDGDADDLSEFKNHGDIFGGTEFVEDRFGNEASAVSFDGDGDYIRVPDSESLDLEAELTLSLWFYFTPQEISTWYTLFEKTGPADGHARYGFWVIRDLAELCVEPAVNAPRVGPQRCFDSTVSLVEDEWNHIVGVYDGSRLFIFINNEPAGELGGAPSDISTTDDPLYIGTDLNAGRPNYLQGQLDDIRIYNRVLDEDEITMLFEWEPEADEE